MGDAGPGRGALVAAADACVAASAAEVPGALRVVEELGEMSSSTEDAESKDGASLSPLSRASSRSSSRSSRSPSSMSPSSTSPSSSSSTTNVRVSVRFRPLSDKQLQRQQQRRQQRQQERQRHTVVHGAHGDASEAGDSEASGSSGESTMDSDIGDQPGFVWLDGERCVHLRAASQSGLESAFTFDRVFRPEASQAEVYDFCAKPLVNDAVLNGYNCTIFAYGQTGSGKTHTMMGPDGGEAGLEAGLEAEAEQGASAGLRGIVPRIASDLFVAMSSAAAADSEFTLKVSYVEIYMERIRDLLNHKQNLRIREDKARGVVLEGAQEQYVGTPGELLRVAAKGAASRAIASTRMNQDSSRSHSVLMVTVDQRDVVTAVRRTATLYLVDLAGSESVKKTGAADSVLEEAKMINRSLSALGNVIKALVDGKRHVPYRDSKLTRLLQDSLGGNAKTSLVITCSCEQFNAAETLSTLRFGARAKQVKNKPTVNQEASPGEYKARLAQAQAAIRELSERLLKAQAQVEARDLAGAEGQAQAQAQTQAGPPPPPATPQPPPPPPPPPQPAADAGLLRRAEEALTISLETADKLRRRLDGKVGEARVSKQALEGTRRRCLELEERLAASTHEQAALVQRVASLELFREEAVYNTTELELTIQGLRGERTTLLKELDDDEALGRTRRRTASSDRNASESETAADETETAETAEAKAEGQQTQQQQTQTQEEEEELQGELADLTDKYIKLRLEHLEVQEALTAAEDNDLRQLRETLRSEREHNLQLNRRLKSAHAKAELARQGELTMRMKLANRESQIQFLEEALRDYQDTFKKSVTDYQQSLGVLHAELAHYKKALDGIDAASDVDADVGIGSGSGTDFCGAAGAGRGRGDGVGGSGSLAGGQQNDEGGREGREGGGASCGSGKEPERVYKIVPRVIKPIRRSMRSVVDARDLGDGDIKGGAKPAKGREGKGEAKREEDDDDMEKAAGGRTSPSQASWLMNKLGRLTPTKR